jgi:hypothetical protein
MHQSEEDNSINSPIANPQICAWGVRQSVGYSFPLHLSKDARLNALSELLSPFPWTSSI